MKTIVLIALIGGVCLGGASCKKFLAESSQSEFTPQTTESYSELLFGTGYLQPAQRFEQILPYLDDDVQVYSGIQAGGQPLAGMTPVMAWQPDYFTLVENTGWMAQGDMDGYANAYSHIVGANIALQYVDGSIGAQADKDYLKGEAFALRAYYYFMLVNLYGRPYNDSTIDPANSPGVPLMLSSNLSNDLPARNSVAQVYTQIIQDLDSAYARLDGAQRSGDIYRLNHISAHLLGSRVRLFMCQWDSVINDANYVINFQPQLMDLNTWGSGYSFGSSTFIPIIGQGNAETLWTFGDISDNYCTTGSIVAGMSADLLNQFDPNDLRGQIYFGTLPSFMEMYVTVLTNYEKFPAGEATNISNTGFTGEAFRTSEAYLNRAEAYAQKFILTGDQTAENNALADLNTLRIKRFPTGTYQPLGQMTPDSLLQFCRNERRREFFFEGHRWFDLRRYGMPSIAHYISPEMGVNQKYVLLSHDPQYTLPIPPTAIALNPNLVQNPLGPERQPSN